ncbi:hypothetical protein Pint_32523 [Pistacia integerrima]|uniref:Uncharacterized protein n=1 Tax=Pistacia integerrima TaxID=434235 RepID=A0ACC0XQZ5_9ROSI|nr:hypothetical protein Pint_32523 [Pistacia integerrima]
MAVEPAFGNKRKRMKLKDGERVEVRSEEHGFLGSWHSGVVTVCRKLLRHVKYDHLLTDDGCDNLIDLVRVSPIVDGTCCTNANQCHNRGNIRPLPPAFEFQKRSLPYGLCVDAYYKEAWWEGVIFDHNDGFQERRIFFPDLGDEMAIGIDSLRVTHDWNEGKGTWHRRGTWLFLELIEEYEKESYLTVSVKQIWYDLRGKKGFKKVKDWTSSVRSLWKELVSEVIDDNYKILLDNVQRVLGHPFSLEKETQRLLEFASPVGDVTLHPVELGKSQAIVSGEKQGNCDGVNVNHSSTQPVQEKSDQLQLISVSEDAGPNLNLMNGSDGFSHDKSLSVLPQALMVLPSNPDRSSGSSVINDSNNKTFSSIKSNKITGEFISSKCKTNWIWRSAVPDIVPGAEYCPTVIIEYAQTNKKSDRNSLKTDVRKHLIHLKWKIEYARDDKGALRHRYISPDGKRHYSLSQVCLDLAETTMMYQDNQQNLHTTPDDTQSSPPEQPEDYWDLDYCPKTVDSSSSKIHVVKPKCNPQAIEDWYKFDNGSDSLKKKDLILNARRHLAYQGWEFKYATTKNRTLYYHAPGGKRYWSLRMACRAYLNGATGLENSASTCRTTDNIISSEEAEDQSTNGKLSCAVSNPQFQKSLVQSNALSKYLCTESSCMSQPRKPTRKRRTSSSQLLQIQDDFCSTSLPKFKRGKASRGLTTLADDLEDGCRSCVLRSSKRVKTPTLSNHNPRTLLSWLIDNNVILPRAKVTYRTRKTRRPNAEGRITREGIRCNCCGKVYTLGGFEIHAGSTLCSPASNIFLEDDERSLLECLLQVLRDGNIRKFTGEQSHELKGSHHDGENDYICSICHYGGELILCDRCPSSFHKHCLGVENVPDGDWFCPSCCCGICGSSKFREDAGNFMDENILICHQCEHKYHRGCIQNPVAADSGTHSKGKWFCSKKCEEIFLGLCQLLGKPIPIGNDLTWTLVKCKEFDNHELDASNIEALSKLNIALCVMHECFEPVNEFHTNRDLVEDVIFGRRSELNRLNFRGFYTVVLEKNEELVTVATIRVYGEKAAEVPLVGTRFQHRRLGMCRILMNELEKKLMELGVQRLILPAIPSVLNTWTTSFGFTKMSNSERLQFVDYTFLDFQDTVMCQKLLLKSTSAEVKLSRGSQPEILSGDDVDLAGYSSVSEVFQAEQIEDSGIVEQRLVDVAVENGNSGSEGWNLLVTMVKQPTHLECESQHTHMSPQCSVVDANFKQETWNRGDGISGYKRRKMAAS